MIPGMDKVGFEPQLWPLRVEAPCFCFFLKEEIDCTELVGMKQVTHTTGSPCIHQKCFMCITVQFGGARDGTKPMNLIRFNTMPIHAMSDTQGTSDLGVLPLLPPNRELKSGLSDPCHCCPRTWRAWNLPDALMTYSATVSIPV